MHTAPLATRSLVWSGSGARCRYVNRICPDLRRRRSPACGSFTLTIMSAPAKTSSAFAAIVAPASRYAASSTPMPCPASCSTATLCPRVTSSCTDAGVSPTRFSNTLISFGTPTRMRGLRSDCDGAKITRELRLRAIPAAKVYDGIRANAPRGYHQGAPGDPMGHAELTIHSNEHDNEHDPSHGQAGARTISLDE